MAIISINHVWSGETWEDEEGAAGYQALYRVISNDPTELVSTVKAALPALGSAYPTDAKAFLKKRSCSRPSDSRLIWEVTLSYEFDEEEPTESPLDEPAKYRWTSSLYTKPIIKDLNDEAVVNSAGDYFDPPPEVEVPRWQCNIQKNVAAVPVAVLGWAGKINDAEVEIDGVTVASGCARIIAMDIGENQEKNDVGYRAFTYTLEFREEGYDLEQLDQGFRINASGELKDILIEDEEGNFNRPSAPVLLDGDGGILSDPSPSNAVFRTFTIHDSLDFTSLPGI